MYKSLLIIFGIIYLAPNGFSKKAIGYLPEPSKKDTETILRIQIFLDEKMFGPGKIDGQMGQFTRKAVAHYNFGYNLKYDNYYKVINESNAVDHKKSQFCRSSVSGDIISMLIHDIR